MVICSLLHIKSGFFIQILQNENRVPDNRQSIDAFLQHIVQFFIVERSVCLQTKWFGIISFFPNSIFFKKILTFIVSLKGLYLYFPPVFVGNFIP
mgnify:CR=1 FL=1